MSEQPKAKRLKLHQKAMQVIPEWMNDWELRYPPNKVCPGPLSLAVSSLRNLDTRLETAFQEDEQIRADLLAACEAVVTLFEPRAGLSYEIDNAFRQTVSRDPVLQRVRAAIAKARETEKEAFMREHGIGPEEMTQHLGPDGQGGFDR